MSNEGKLVAVQLANQRLTESMEKIQAEIEILRAENTRLTEENIGLQTRLDLVESDNKTLQDEYKKGTGQAYVGTMRTSKYGFGK
jgi:FtsZ-binding cell division protein ZapB